VALAEEALTPVEVMAIADDRLYRAKNTGRDRIVMEGRSAMPPVTLSSPLLH
jgi:PleD family two-component response regulator